MTVSESGGLGSIAVYRFVTCNRSNDTFVEHVSMATAATIRRLKGMADLPSKRLVSPDDLDSEGFWRELPASAQDRRVTADDVSPARSRVDLSHDPDLRLDDFPEGVR